MKVLIVEDDFASQVVMQNHLGEYGQADVVADGVEAVAAVRRALEMGEPYRLICLDIMMPNLGGQDTLVQIRQIERESGLPHAREAKIVMTTAVNDLADVTQAYSGLCDGYLTKPIRKATLLETLGKLGLGAP